MRGPEFAYGEITDPSEIYLSMREQDPEGFALFSFVMETITVSPRQRDMLLLALHHGDVDTAKTIWKSRQLMQQGDYEQARQLLEQFRDSRLDAALEAYQSTQSLVPETKLSPRDLLVFLRSRADFSPDELAVLEKLLVEAPPFQARIVGIMRHAATDTAYVSEAILGLKADLQILAEEKNPLDKTKKRKKR